MATLNELIEAASFLIGDSASDNPEYARAMIELIKDVTPLEREDVADLLGITE